MQIPFTRHTGYDPLGDCGKGKCAICARNTALLDFGKQITSTTISSDAVAPFVGRFGYPKVNVGIMAPPTHEDNAWEYDAPTHWSQNNFSIPEIVRFRSSLLNSKSTSSIRAQDKLTLLTQEIAMASKPTDIDIELKEKPHVQLQFDSRMAPSGAQAPIEKAKLTSNPKIHTKVERVFGDTDLKANDALTYLYENKFNENFLTRILSVGTVGVGKNRKLVPTRWSITATDSNLGNHLASTVKNLQEYDYAVYVGGYLGNYFVILMLPEIWSYELFETYTGTPSRFTTDYEPFEGRKKYAEQTAGGFYACRLPVLEHLKKIKRQASVVALRFITDEYTMPLGVHVVREATRKTLAQKPMVFSSKELLLDYVRMTCKKKFGVDADIYLNQSTLLRTIREQRRLTQFFA